MKMPIHPAIVMILFWSFILFVYIWGPVTLIPAMSISGGVFLLAHIGLFIAGSGIAFSLFNQQLNQQHDHKYPDVPRLGKLMSVLLIIGILGGMISLFINLSGIDGISLASLARVRALKAQSLLHHGGEVHGGWLSAIAFLTYPAGFVALVVGVLQYEHLSRFVRLLMFLFVGVIFCVAIIAGGRSPIMVLLLFIGMSCYTRTHLGKSWMPKSQALRLGSAVLLLTFLIYSNIMWSVRVAETERTTEQILKYTADIGGAMPKPYLLAASEKLNSPGLTLSVLNSVFYLTQSLPITEKILATSKALPVMYGSFHVDVIAAALRLFPQGVAYLKQSYASLMNAHVYGYFAGAWGGLFLDFGYFSLLAAMLWGFLAGASWVSFKNNPGVLTGLFYVFWNYSIMISFATPPFGFSNSFIIFGWFLVFYLSIRFLGARSVSAQRDPSLRSG